MHWSYSVERHCRFFWDTVYKAYIHKLMVASQWVQFTAYGENRHYCKKSKPHKIFITKRWVSQKDCFLLLFCDSTFDCYKICFLINAALITVGHLSDILLYVLLCRPASSASGYGRSRPTSAKSGEWRPHVVLIVIVVNKISVYLSMCTVTFVHDTATSLMLVRVQV